MSAQHKELYEFGPFTLDPRERRLLRNGQAIHLQPKTFEVLLYLVKSSGHLAGKEELLSAVWPDAVVEEGNLNLAIHQARRALAGDSEDVRYIETVPKRGYRFIGPVKVIGVDQKLPAEPTKTEPSPAEQRDSTLHRPESNEPRPAGHKGHTKPSLRGVAVGLLIGLALSAVIATAVALRGKRSVHSETEEINAGRELLDSPFDEAEAKRVVKESQLAETLAIYVNPISFDTGLLPKYWVPAESGGKEINEVRAAISRLTSHGTHYGSQSKCELFEFLQARVYAPGDYAEVRTIERWYIPLFRADGTPVLEHNDYLGPQQIDYKLRKINGSWLIQESTTPRPRKK